MTQRTRLVSSLFTVGVLTLVACDKGGSTPAATHEAPATATGDVSAKIKSSLAGSQRDAKERARDAFRHPLETLTFFGLTDAMTVIEVSPGNGWYTAVLAPVLAEHGHLAVTNLDPNGPQEKESFKHARELQDRLSAHPDAFGKVTVLTQATPPPLVFNFGPDNAADMVLTFRNVHNWVKDGNDAKFFAAAFKALKHGGTLGLTDHRAAAGADPQKGGETGYLPEDYVVHQAEAAGFKLAGKSEINANPKDTKDYEKGVWTLPPTYQLGEKDRARYEAIGESDRMTLKFVKP